MNLGISNVELIVIQRLSTVVRRCNLRGWFWKRERDPTDFGMQVGCFGLYRGGSSAPKLVHHDQRELSAAASSSTLCTASMDLNKTAKDLNASLPSINVFNPECAGQELTTKANRGSEGSSWDLHSSRDPIAQAANDEEMVITGTRFTYMYSLQSLLTSSQIPE